MPKVQLRVSKLRKVRLVKAAGAEIGCRGGSRFVETFNRKGHELTENNINSQKLIRIFEHNMNNNSKVLIHQFKQIINY